MFKFKLEEVRAARRFPVWLSNGYNMPFSILNLQKSADLWLSPCPRYHSNVNLQLGHSIKFCLRFTSDSMWCSASPFLSVLNHISRVRNGETMAHCHLRLLCLVTPWLQSWTSGLCTADLLACGLRLRCSLSCTSQWFSAFRSG
jgi:hypothetical protein